MHEARITRLRAAIGGRSDIVHLNNAGVAPMCRPARQAVEGCARLMEAEGYGAIPELIQMHERARRSFARLVGTAPDNVAMTQTCAASISMVAFGMQLAPGDEIVRLDQEYPSNGYPWHSAARRSGAKVNVVSSGPGLRVDVDRMLAAIGPNTKVVAASWVQFQTGEVLPLERLAEACRKVGAWFVVDAIQGLGVLPFDMDAIGIDAVCSGTHKWLCGPLGHGFLAVRPERIGQLEPILQGAMTFGTPDDPVVPENPPRPDARRFEPGTPPLLGAVGGAAAIELLLDIGVEHINKEALRLADELMEGLRSRSVRLLNNPDAAVRSPIVNFVPAGDPEKVVDGLVRRGVACATRAGGVRVAPHAFNTEYDLERFFEAYDEVVAQAEREG